ncbi:hypothetical protein Gasu2_67660 [Galdieria sulphuraria]|nr:hypothetical protein Gasu2_67660 [Galdieria sulphuraria]
MDLQGQAICERYTKRGIFLTTVVSLVVAIVTDDYKTTFKGFLIGVFLVALWVLPSWPFYRRHPLHFVTDKSMIES